VQLGHGSGGKMSAELLRERFLPRFGSPFLAELGDGARIPVSGTCRRGSSESTGAPR
jgi:hypothetical protein